LVASFFNSLIYASFPVLIGVFASALSAYAFAKLEYKGRSTVYQAMIFTLMVPGCVSMSSSYVLFDSFGWTRGEGLSLPLIIPSCFGGIGTVMFLREYFKGVPDDMLAAAKIDGCGKLHVFTAIMIPLGMPAIVAQLVLGFIGAYNDYQSALIYLRYPEQYTIQLALSFFNGGYSDKALASAGAVFGIVPLLVLYIIFQNKIIAGISFSSGLKG
jgi:multiple sugar transport system permease protein